MGRMVVLRAAAIAAVIGGLSLASGTAHAGYTAVATVNWGTDTTISGTASTDIDEVFATALASAGITGETVTISGAIADSSYTADGNVVGTVNSSGAVTSYTLANYTNGNTFLQNNSEGNPASNLITVTFSTPLPTTISAVSFNYEIFPDISCTDLNNGGRDCGGNGHNGYPDLPSLSVTDNAANTATIFQRYAVVPGTSLGTVQASCSGVTGQTNCGGGGSSSSTVATTYTQTYSGTVASSAAGDVTDHSETSGAVVDHGQLQTSDPELAPQLLGTSGIVALNLPTGTGLSVLTFNDWPATIAVSNISFYKKVPEPGSLAMLATGVLILGVFWRRKSPRQGQV